VNNQADVLSRLAAWYAGQCDGNWEHAYGVAIDTLDNPGWSVRVDLRETNLDGAPFARVETNRGEHDSLVCWVENAQFNATCGPRNLGEALRVFVDWVDADVRAR
jgi:Immunity protein 53